LVHGSERELTVSAERNKDSGGSTSRPRRYALRIHCSRKATFMDNVASALFGAALVAVGVLAAALADRIRGLRVAREAALSKQVRRERLAAVIPIGRDAARPAELLCSVADSKPSGAVHAGRRAPATTGGDDVIAALLAAGYKKPIATEATWSCDTVERATIESWAAAALRRLARGGVS
jgi:hypothetical protein